MPAKERDEPAMEIQSVDARAAQIFIHRQSGSWSALDQADFEAWSKDPACAEAYLRISGAWRAVGTHAAAPELMVRREQALARARRTGIGRWNRKRKAPYLRWAAAAAVVVAVGLGFRLFPDRVTEAVYRTDIGEQRLVELSDESRIALDAQTEMRVRLSGDSRVVELLRGQAQFMVAPDARRPFRVEAGAHTITAVGTSFNVEYLDRQVGIGMVEGKVTVTVGSTARATRYVEQGRGSGGAASQTTDLVAGEELRIYADGQSQLLKEVDVTAIVAWRQGKIILNDASLADAVQRLNRYSRLQMAIGDPALGALRVNGVFESGDTRAFLEAVQSYLPVSVQEEGPDLLLLAPVQ